MARLGRVGFLTLAVVFHLIYTYSIFDIYFVSPIVSGMKEYGVERDPGAKAPAKRLFLFVGDGLRADKAFQYFPDPSLPENPCLTNGQDGTEKGIGCAEPDLTPIPLAPFVRSRVLSHGTFGVSHTRVPTESRPGHVALIAGLYEDVSAVTTGWKLNPVNFDSVFNRSRHTWSWGSPDILPMFKEGAVPGRIYADTYGEEEEDFTQDSTKLDIWVFDRVKALFAAAKEDKELNKRLREDKVVFFLHLLGLDTAGHSYRPYSKEYLRNIQVVDQGVREITELVEQFYGDDDSAFVFTADHGMSDWGSHGDGHPDNTRTPLVAWGAGIPKPTVSKYGIAPGHEDGFSSDWNLDHIQRHDVAQADVAALMAYLVGLDYPVNSVGELPLSYINAPIKEKAKATLANAQGVLEMYRVKEEQKRTSALCYKGYAPFTEPQRSPESQIAAIRDLIFQGQYEESITKSRSLLHDGLEGLRYLQTYDWLFLRAVVTAGYLGWIAYALTTVMDLHVLHGAFQSSRTTATNIFFSSLLVGLYSVLWIQNSSWRYYFYGFFPVFFWEEVIARRSAISAGRKVLLAHVHSFRGYVVLTLQTLLYIGLLEALVQSYFHREIFTTCYFLAALWPAFYGTRFLLHNKLLVIMWIVGCSLMSIFTLLPVIKVENSNLVSIGGLLMFLFGVSYLFFEDAILNGSQSNASTKIPNNTSRIIMGVQIGLIALSVIVTKSSIESLQSRNGLPLGNQVVGWIVLVSSLLLPFFHKWAPNNHYLHRLAIIFLTFSPTFIILTISYEGFFYLAFCMTVLNWVGLEHKMREHTSLSTPQKRAESEEISNRRNADYPYRAIDLSDARVALFFFFLLQSAFFSTGNIASVSSFSMESVTRLIPVFSPFSQGALLILKILIPFAIISANLGILNRRLGVPPSALFMIVISISDVMTLNFFYMVRDEGSWLDIGTTISQFVISSALCIFVAGLEFLSGPLVAGVEFEEEEGAKAKNNGSTNGDSNGSTKQKDSSKSADSSAGGKGTGVSKNGSRNGASTATSPKGDAVARKKLRN